MPKQREITGRFLGERHAFINGAGADFETRTIIAEIEETESGEKMTIKGEASEGALRFDLTYRLYGYTRNHSKYGQQFCFDAFVVESPATQEAVVSYLRQCKGIGPATAYAMFDLWGEKAVDKLCYEPAEVIKEIPRLSLAKAEAASEFLKRFEGTRRAKMDMLTLINGCGLPKKMVDAIVKKYGSAAAELVRENPYLLMDFKGCGFLKADKIYLELGHDPAALYRQSLCVWYAIANKGNPGDTWIHQNIGRKYLEANVGVADPNFLAALALAINSKLLAKRTDSMGSTWLACATKAAAEDRVARYVAEAAEEAESRGTLWPDVDGLDISEHQREQLQHALGNNMIGILAGSPGTGKTYTAAAVVRRVIELVGSDKVAAAAPTGKAAVRFTESLHNCGIPLKAVTTHSLLKVESSGGEGWSFHFGRENPLPYLFVLFDEKSMTDTTMEASTLAARGPGTHFLFLGDIEQLAPVGHGAPLRDMIAAGVPTGTLKEIRRNSGRIVKACAEIRDTKRFAASPAIDLDAGENLKVIECEDTATQIEVLQNVMGQFLNVPEKKHDPIWDIQILVAVNKKSELGRKPLNFKLQDLMNPHGERAQGNPFRVGDKIINTKNGWLPQPPDAPVSADANDDGKLYVANGEQAEVLQVEVNKTVARLTNPDRIVLIPRGTQDDRSSDDDADPDRGSEATKELDEEKQTTGTGCNWELGYAISGHKSQGSEWPIVIVMLDEHNSARQVCTRNWIYTCVSRAKTLCLMIGKKATADEFCQRDGLRRKTFLVERLRELRPAVSAEPIETIERAETTKLFQELGELLQGVC